MEPAPREVCQWYETQLPTTCRKLEMPIGRMWSMGPDFGGTCSPYSTLGCDAGSEVAVGEGAGEKSIACPEKGLTPNPALDRAFAMKFFASTAVYDPAVRAGKTTTINTVVVTPSPVKRLMPEHAAKFPSTRGD
ncbi:hypothetical protein DPSP01_006109 [Paraphaeosphaeria sporulosa]